jgi:YHS domain-containing protein
MHAHTHAPVVIFLPVTREAHGPDHRVADPVCGRLLSGEAIVGRLAYDGQHYHFCSLSCAGRFAHCPTDFGPG